MLVTFNVNTFKTFLFSGGYICGNKFPQHAKKSIPQIWYTLVIALVMFLVRLICSVSKRFCNVFDSDIENGIILEECIQPGIRLRDEQSLEKRLNVFSNLYNGLHIEPENPNMYPTYIEWVSRITKYMSSQEDYKELYLYMKMADDICLQISQSYNKKMLLHGDFHHDNILLNNDGKYKIIDPKGVVGDPIFDVPRYILNEYEENISAEKYYGKICTIINSLETSLSIPKKIIKQCYFIEMAMANCWEVESNAKPDIQSVIMAENIMNCS